ncbi:hypothetical protein DPMN_112119 [Dreissena polymorpha]|uniref:Uncharacterized protein n=1 Tax=Dreissena polymorpha TaxID=45954 RepID=A0A9D4KGG1_DREPO|nr:hypothetical protein DPMN_112119 [Dreissena polymorpha]
MLDILDAEPGINSEPRYSPPLPDYVPANEFELELYRIYGQPALDLTSDDDSSSDSLSECDDFCYIPDCFCKKSDYDDESSTYYDSTCYDSDCALDREFSLVTPEFLDLITQGKFGKRIYSDSDSETDNELEEDVYSQQIKKRIKL